MPKRSNCWLPLAMLVWALHSCAQPADSSKAAVTAKPAADTLISLTWQQLAPGVDYCQTDAPFKSIVNDSKLTVLRINPKQVTFELHCATAHDRKARTVTEWADSFDLDIVFNAGMYDLSNKLVSRGLLQDRGHVNNGALHPTFNSMLAFHPTDSTQPGYDIIDLQCEDWQQAKKRYQSYAQGLRMLDCNGLPMSWNKRKQSCSMLVAAKDANGNLYLVFTRSPYLHNDMIRFLRRFPDRLTHAIYLEGGPETSLYARIGETVIEKVGSYVSQTYENDANDHFWKLPNVIGIKLKQQ